jgi:hypothetical protein
MDYMIGWKCQIDGRRELFWVRRTTREGFYEWLHPMLREWIGEPHQIEMPSYVTYESAYEALLESDPAATLDDGAVAAELYRAGVDMKTANTKLHAMLDTFRRNR